MSAPAWHEERGEVLAFARAMSAAHEFDGPDGVIYYFEKPWKWDREHDAWVLAGRPDAFEVTP